MIILNLNLKIFQYFRILLLISIQTPNTIPFIYCYSSILIIFKISCLRFLFYFIFLLDFIKVFINIIRINLNISKPYLVIIYFHFAMIKINAHLILILIIHKNILYNLIIILFFIICIIKPNL